MASQRGVPAQRHTTLPDRTEEAESLVRVLLDAAPDGLALVDAEGTIVLVNRRLEEMLGYSHGALVGEPIELLVAVDIRKQHAAMRTGLSDASEARHMGLGRYLVGRCADGAVLPVEVGLSVLATHDYGLCQIAAIRDDTARRDAARQQAKAQAVQEELRIAEGLADTVIAGLFGAGLTLAGTVEMCREPAQSRIREAILSIDHVIDALRELIFDFKTGGGDDD